MASHRSAQLLVALVCCACIPWAACSEIFPQRTPGEKLYRKRCASCHGIDARGNTLKYMSNAKADLTDDTWYNGQGSDAMAMVIENGVFGSMPDNKDLSQEEIRQIVEHLETVIEKSRSLY
ncbi:MAG: cytochrome c [Thermoanaerobaculia bacterium]|nr:cytochrome c [Thermoanaerobaculia bacterium]